MGDGLICVKDEQVVFPLQFFLDPNFGFQKNQSLRPTDSSWKSLRGDIRGREV